MQEHSTAVIDVGEADFHQQVLLHSYRTPVVVDFWAEWCGPCRMLGPLLERVAAEAAGAFRLVKVNTDENPGLAAQYGIRSIPAVKAFRDGRVVDEFIGALPEAQVRGWLQGIMPSEADRLADEAAALQPRGELSVAERLYREALSRDAGQPTAIIGLSQLLIDRGDADEARGLLARLSGNPDAARLLAELELKRGAGDIDNLRSGVASRPDDPGARHRLGAALAAAGDHEAALEELLASVRLDRHHQDDAARKLMLQLFQLLGDRHPLTIEHRRRLSSLLF